MLTTLLRKLERLEVETRAANPQADPALAALKADPARAMRALGLRPDPWQEALLRAPSSQMLLVLTSRQSGKSTTAAALAAVEALTRPRSLVLLLSPSERQSGELASKVFAYHDALGQPVPARKRTELQLHLANGSRVVALPENERTIRGYSGARLLVVDEAARVGDSLYRTVRPMLAVSRGRLLAMSTPFGKRGWFYEEWRGGGAWGRVEVPASAVSRIPASFLAEERRALGERWYRQEYQCSFEETTDSVFTGADIDAMFDDDVCPLPLTLTR